MTKHLNLLVLCISSFMTPLCGMKRNNHEDNPSKKACIAEKTQYSADIRYFPSDVKLIIIEKLINGSDTIGTASISIRVLTETNHAFHRLINDERNNKTILQMLADKFTDGDLIIAANALHTNAAKKWLLKNYPLDTFQFVRSLCDTISKSAPNIMGAWGIPENRSRERFIFTTQRLRALRNNPILAQCINNLYCHIHLVKELSRIIAGNNFEFDQERIRTAKIIHDLDLLAPGNTEIYRWLAQRKDAVIEAAKIGNIPFLKRILENGADINQSDMQGDNALMNLVFTPDYIMDTYHISREQLLEMARFLIKNNININAANHQNVDIGEGYHYGGSTALMLAALAGFLPGVQLLLEYPINLYTIDIEENNALHRAIDGLVSVVRNGGSNPNEINSFLEIIKLLILRDVNPTAKNKKGVAPFGILQSFVQEVEDDEGIPYPEGRALMAQIKEIFDHFGITTE